MSVALQSIFRPGVRGASTKGPLFGGDSVTVEPWRFSVQYMKDFRDYIINIQGADWRLS